MDQKVTLIDKKSHQGIEVNASDKIQLSAQSPSVVQLKISSEDIKEYKKEGNNLVVVLKSGEIITIMGFFDADNSLVLQDDVNHKLLWVEFSSNGESLSVTYAELNDVGPLLYGESDATSPWAWAAVPLVAGGSLAWAGHDSGNDSENGTGETNEGPSAPESVVIRNGDEWITADEIDADGKVDVKIDLPVDAIAGDSVIVNGEETELTDADILAGNIIVKVDAPNEGETLEVVATIKDAAGNESSPATDSAVVNLLVLENDSANAVYQESQVNPNPIGELTSDTAIKLLAGSSATDKLEFSIANGAQDVVITVKSESLVTVADAYSFTVVNKATGQEYTVAASSTAQGGLVAGALGLEALGVVGDDSNGLRLDIHDLPPGDYEVVVQGDQSKLADILSTVSLEDLGSNTVETLILDTVTGLLKDALIGNDNIATGLLKQISVNEMTPTLARVTDIRCIKLHN